MKHKTFLYRWDTKRWDSDFCNIHIHFRLEISIVSEIEIQLIPKKKKPRNISKTVE
jgi:hypothetical protein